MRRRLAVFLFAAFVGTSFGARTSGQQVAPTQPAPPATGLIVGQVVDSRDGSGVAGAQLTLTFFPANPTPAEVGVPLPNLRLIADGQGRFVYHSLRSGKYTLRASAGGFMLSAYMQTEPNGLSQMLELSEGQRVANVTIKMWRYSSISGIVRDEAGEPVVGQRVQLVQRYGTGSAQRYLPRESADTDDRGLFRFSELAPADYLVMVATLSQSAPVSVLEAYRNAPRSGGPGSSISTSVSNSGGSMNSDGVRIGDIATQPSPSLGAIRATAEAGRYMVYATTFHPSATTPALAGVITLGAGEEKTGVDVVLKPVPATTVTGRVIGPNGPGSYLTVKFIAEGMHALQSAGLGSFEAAAVAITAEDGSFSALGVPAGNYDVSVHLIPRPTYGPSPQSFGVTVSKPGGGTSSSSTSMGASPQTPPTDPVLWGRTSLAVGSSRIEGVTVQLAVAAVVTGRIEFDSSGIPLPPEARLRTARISLSPLDGSAGLGSGTFSGSVAADRTFRSQGYPPGRYIFRVSPPSIPPGWYVKSITSGGRDLRSEPLDLASSDITDVVVTYTDKVGTVTGTVTRPAANTQGMVMMVPATVQALERKGMLPSLVQASLINPDGTYLINGVLPGDYLVFAIANPRALQELDNERLAALALKGVRVTIGSGERRVLSLSITPVKQP